MGWSRGGKPGRNVTAEHKEDFNTAYPPEKEIDLTKEYPAKGGTKVKWQKANFPDGQVHSLLGKFKHNDDSCCYLYREITCTSDTELPCSFGSDDTLSVWINGER